MICQLDIIRKKQRKASKKAFERYLDLSEEKNKRESMVANNTKIFVSMKNKSQLSIGKNIMKYGKIKPLQK